MLERRADDGILERTGLKGPGRIEDGYDRNPGRVDQASGLSDALGGGSEYER